MGIRRKCNKERKCIVVKKFFKKIRDVIVSAWDGIRFAVILWKEGKDGRGEDGV